MNASPLTGLTSQIADCTQILRESNDRAAGLSPAEISLVEMERVRESSRLIYERAYARAVCARDALLARLRHGVPAIVQLPNGGYDAMDGMAHEEARRLIHTYSECARMLWRAAELVCDVEELPDDGERAGIKWEALL